MAAAHLANLGLNLPKLVGHKHQVLSDLCAGAGRVREVRVLLRTSVVRLRRPGCHRTSVVLLSSQELSLKSRSWLRRISCLRWPCHALCFLNSARILPIRSFSAVRSASS